MKNNMEREFIPYEQALALKGLSFDEQCFSFYNIEGELYESEGYYRRGYNVHEDEVIAPLYQQAFRWFREKHGLDSHVYRPDEKLKIWGYNTTLHVNVSPFKTYEEAEQACLDKLIEIVKEK